MSLSGLFQDGAPAPTPDSSVVVITPAADLGSASPAAEMVLKEEYDALMEDKLLWQKRAMEAANVLQRIQEMPAAQQTAFLNTKPGDPSPNAPTPEPHWKQTIRDWAYINFSAMLNDWPAPHTRLTQAKLEGWLQELFTKLGA